MHPYASARARSATRKPADAKLSAARAAAEAAFMGRSEMPAPGKVSDAVVVLRRKSKPIGSHSAGPSVRAEPEDTGSADGEAPAQRQPRVFRMPEAELPAGAAASAAPAELPSEAALAVSRAERVGHDRRAGEIRLVRPEPVPEMRAALPAVLPAVIATKPISPTPVPILAPVREQLLRLAELEPVFALIRQAQAFTLRDAHVQAEWLRIETITRRLALDLTLVAARRAEYERAFRGFL